METFQLDRRLAADSHSVCALDLSDVRLMNDSRYVWLLLVPRKPGVSEWHDLTEQQAGQLSSEIHRASAALKAQSGADKINVAAIGNMVRQMHVHVVARREGDDTWPGTVWNSGQAKPYTTEALEALCEAIRQALNTGA